MEASNKTDGLDFHADGEADRSARRWDWLASHRGKFRQSMASAVEEAHRLNATAAHLDRFAGEFEAYKCRWCEHWHVGHKPDKKKIRLYNG